MPHAENTLHLAAPAAHHRESAQRFIAEFRNAGERIYGGCSIARYPFEQWLPYIVRQQSQRYVAPGMVPSTTYFSVVGEQVVGVVNIRHFLNDDLAHGGGHIGYSIAPSQRGKGYGTRQLELALQKVRELGQSRALITCDLENIASARTIENAGGTLENERMIDGGVIRRYWVTL